MGSLSEEDSEGEDRAIYGEETLVEERTSEQVFDRRLFCF